MTESIRLKNVQTPVIPLISDLIRANPGTISLGQGVVNYPPPESTLRAVKDFYSNPENNKYQATEGIAELRDLITKKLEAENNIKLGLGSKTRVMVTAGSNQAFLNVIFAILDPGDEIILPVPYYFNHEMAITMASARPVYVSTDHNFQLDIEAIKSAINSKTRAIVTVSPNNPSGAIYSEEAIRAVNALCADKGLYHITDEAYEYFTYGNIKHFSAGSINGADKHTISLFSMSKAYGFASWRIGWMLYPSSLDLAIQKTQDTLIICPPVISQFAATAALREGYDYVYENIQGIKKNRDLLKSELFKLEHEGLLRTSASAGALYFLLQLHSPLSSINYVRHLIQQYKIAVIPGETFGLDQHCHLRVSFGALDQVTAKEGIERLVKGIRCLRS